MAGWMSAVVALAAPLLVAGVAVYGFTSKRVGAARHARRRTEAEADVEVEQWYADGPRSPWQPRAGDWGASAVEYGLLVAAIAGLIIAVTFGLGGAISAVFSKTGSHLEHCTGANPSPCPDDTSTVQPTDPPAAT